MRPDEYGIEEIVGDDRAYAGSRFADVRDAVFANPYPGIWDANGRMPVYPVTFASVVRGLLPLGRDYLFGQASARALDSHADLRWGPDRKGFRRLVHPNGICLSGIWEVTEKTAYSGYFAGGSRALVLGRYSTCCSDTTRGRVRSLALIAKLFPTTDPEHPTPLRTASLVTQQDIGGDTASYINDVELRNAPDTTSWRRGGGVPILVVTGAVFNYVDRQPTIRQLYAVAELGKSGAEPTRAPRFLRLLVASNQPRVHGADLDFRDEIMRQVFDLGDRAPKRSITFDIEVTDHGETHGTPVFQRRTFHDWRRIGTLTFDNAVASYNGDFVIHFNHPTWRTNRNDPSTSTRVGEAKRW